MAGVIQKPENINLSGNLKPFVVAKGAPVSFVLKKGEEILLSQEYVPTKGIVEIDVKEIVEAALSFTLNTAENNYINTKIAETFTATIDETDYTFRVVRAGVDNLADTALNWLRLHYLTWQPSVKEVTYYSPEWLTYYAVENCIAKLKATFADKTSITITLGTLSAGLAYTYNLQYATVAGLLGEKYPSFFEVWIENTENKISESQIYAFSDAYGYDEQWYIFENSLGGIDTFRAFGVDNFAADHEHNIAEFGDEIKEYDIDTSRKHTKNTGHLDEYQRRWLLDFFPSKAKYVYFGSTIRKIVVHESNATYVSNELPSFYSFTWTFAKVSIYMNLVKNESLLPDNLVAPDLSAPDFILPPRLAELPRVSLSEGVLIPAFDPDSTTSTVTTYGAVHETIKNAVVGVLIDEIQGIEWGSGGGELELEIITSLALSTSVATDKNVYSALATTILIKDAFNKVLQDIDGKYLSRIKDDTAEGNLTFNKELEVIGLATFHTATLLDAFYSNEDGDIYGTDGFYISANGPAWFDESRFKGGAQFAKSLSSPDFVSGFPNGIGWMLADYERINAAEVAEKKYKLEIDDLTVRGKFRVFEMIYSQLRGENDNVIFAGQMKVDHLDAANNTIYLDTEEGILYNPFREGDILMVQQITGLPSAENDYNVVKQYELRVVEASIGSLDDKEKRVDYIRFENFVGELTDIAEGDVLTRVDSVTDSTRKGVIKLTTIDEFGAPYIDVIYGMKTDPQNATKMRMGRLDGLVTPYWGRLDGYGLMCVNAYLKGKFLLQTGEDILTKFEITEGLIRSEIGSIREEVSAEYNYLTNASFTSNTNGWVARNNVKLFTVKGKFLYYNDNFSSDKRNLAAVVVEGNRRALRLKDSLIYQPNENLANKPTEEDMIQLEDGTSQWPQFYISLKYKVVRAGTLTIGFPDQELYFTQDLTPAAEYKTLEYKGAWDGTGDFTVSFSGDIYIYSLAVADNPLENFKIEMKTRFYETDSRIGMWGEKTDKLQGTILQMGVDINLVSEQLNIYSKKTNALEGTTQALGLRLDSQQGTLSLYATRINTLEGTSTQLGLDLNALSKSLSLYVKDTDITGQELVSRIEMAPGNVKISADRIDLVGKVTASMLSTEILEAGKIKATLIDTDTIYANQARIGGFSIQNGRLVWTLTDYFGGTSRSLLLGSGNGVDGVVNVSFNAATDGKYGVKSVGSAFGGACIYGSTGALNTPGYGNTYAGFFDGMVDVLGDLVSNVCASQSFRAISSRNSNGTYYYTEGISFDPGSYDLDDIRLRVRNGIIVGVTNDSGKILQGV